MGDKVSSSLKVILEKRDFYFLDQDESTHNSKLIIFVRTKNSEFEINEELSELNSLRVCKEGIVILNALDDVECFYQMIWHYN